MATGEPGECVVGDGELDDGLDASHGAGPCMESGDEGGAASSVGATEGFDSAPEELGDSGGVGGGAGWVPLVPEPSSKAVTPEDVIQGAKAKYGDKFNPAKVTATLDKSADSTGNFMWGLVNFGAPPSRKTRSALRQQVKGILCDYPSHVLCMCECTERMEQWMEDPDAASEEEEGHAAAGAPGPQQRSGKGKWMVVRGAEDSGLAVAASKNHVKAVTCLDYWRSLGPSAAGALSE